MRSRLFRTERPESKLGGPDEWFKGAVVGGRVTSREQEGHAIFGVCVPGRKLVMLVVKPWVGVVHT